MPMEKFTFDGPNKQFVARPEFVDTDGEMEVNVQIDLYSAWKDVVRETDNMKYLQAMRSVGGDPISGSQNLGATYFLTNGWRILPASQDHRLKIDGNIVTDPFGSPITDFPSGGSVIVENTVSNLVDSSVARIDLTQLLPAIFIDADNGSDTAAGTPTAPVQTVAAARALADADNLREYHFRGAITLSQDHTDWTFVGLSAETNDQIEFAGFDVDKSKFTGCSLTGIMTGIIEADQCGINIVSGLDGVFRDCGFPTSFNIADYAEVTMANCFSEVPGSGTPSCSFGANSTLSMRGYNGGIQLQNFNSAGFSTTIDLASGHVVIGPSCTAGEIVIRGIGKLTDNSAGATVDKTGLVEGTDTRLARQILQGKTITNPTTGQIEVYDDAGVLLFTADIFEDADGLTAYSLTSTKIERREKLT